MSSNSDTVHNASLQQRDHLEVTNEVGVDTYTRRFKLQGISVDPRNSPDRPIDDYQSGLGINRQRTRIATELSLRTTHGRSPRLSLEPSSSQPPVAPYPEESNKADMETARQDVEWEEMRRRCFIVNHPMFPQLLAKHAACLRVGTPVNLLPEVEARLIHEAPEVTEKYRVHHDQITVISPEEQADLDQFMKELPLALGSFEQTLQHHVQTSVTEAMKSCWEIERELYNLTGARVERGNLATMSDSEEDYDPAMDGHNFGPLVPSESERALMERVRDELKHKLKEGYASKIAEVHDQIVSRKKSRKLPEGATAILKNWWEAHAHCPYPTVEDKKSLIELTGAKRDQINNWFINQRARKRDRNLVIPTSEQAVHLMKGKGQKSR